MIDEKTYKRELIRIWDSVRETHKGELSCDGVLCGNCPLEAFEGCASVDDIFDIYNEVKMWSNKHRNKEEPLIIIDKETYMKELIRMWDTTRTKNKGKPSCDGDTCEYCILSEFDGCLHAADIFNICGFVENWSNERQKSKHIKEHQKQKYMVSRIEYDILRIAIDYSVKDTIFKDFYMLTELLKEGYFKDATFTTNIRYYFDNCEVEDDNEKNNNGGNSYDRN